MQDLWQSAASFSGNELQCPSSSGLNCVDLNNLLLCFNGVQVLGYYSGEENAYDMRKAMARDVQKKSVVPLKKPVNPEDLEFD